MWTREGEGPHPPGCGTPPTGAIADEAADVFLSLINFCAAADVDLLAAAHEKLDRLAMKYPIETAKGSAVKHTETSSG